MTPVTGPQSGSGSFLVFTGADCETLREVLTRYIRETEWTVTYEPHDEIDKAMLEAIGRRRALCERGIA